MPVLVLMWLQIPGETEEDFLSDFWIFERSWYFHHVLLSSERANTPAIEMKPVVRFRKEKKTNMLANLETEYFIGHKKVKQPKYFLNTKTRME